MGTDPAFAPKVATPGLPAWVDVRNVADAHAHALTLPQGTSERFLLCGGVDYFEDGLQGLKARGEKGLGVGARCDQSKHFALDRSKAEKMLELSFIPFGEDRRGHVGDVEDLGLCGLDTFCHSQEEPRRAAVAVNACIVIRSRPE
jgi:hypothetical protein